MSSSVFIVNLVIRSLFVILGLLVCFGFFLQTVDDLYRYGIGVLMIVYGAYRLYQLFNEKKKLSNNDSSN